MFGVLRLNLLMLDPNLSEGLNLALFRTGSDQVSRTGRLHQHIQTVYIYLRYTQKLSVPNQIAGTWLCKGRRLLQNTAVLWETEGTNLSQPSVSVHNPKSKYSHWRTSKSKSQGAFYLHKSKRLLCSEINFIQCDELS